MSTALAEVELSRAAADDYVHFGDVLQLVHLETGRPGIPVHSMIGVDGASGRIGALQDLHTRLGFTLSRQHSISLHQLWR
jgi:hypothetical protein